MIKISNPESFRKNISNKIASMMNIEDENEKRLISGNIEKGIFNYTIDDATNKNVIKKWDNDTFVLLYINRLRSIYTNLKNVELVNQIKNGTVKAEDVGAMTHQQLNPDNWVC